MGGDLATDSHSYAEGPSGYSAHDPISLGF